MYFLSLQIEMCIISDKPGLELCSTKYGSHEMTFWIYFGLRLVFQWAFIGVFSIFDGTSAQLANEHGGTYSEIFMYMLLASVIATFLPTLVMSTQTTREGNRINNSTMCMGGVSVRMINESQLRVRDPFLHQ